ncbi:expressed unknown protein [Seminavis robusta]|uniref:Uncharacterized protein n=1 Tax=Seminavis robusta TaxID=568900 RepID=A0A9N8E0U9_9STRA|nr:expressed unknown protein [Seminavis robusta]|eukprot:Sro508_g156630.1 n/a (170) ;mRNA; r:4884-5550
MSLAGGKSAMAAQVQTICFRQFLNNPQRFASAWKKGKHKESNSAGPFRPKKIQEMSDILAKSFVILNVQRPQYGVEESQIAVLDKGKLLAIYKITTKQGYQPSRKGSRDDKHRHHRCHTPCSFEMVSSAALFVADQTDGQDDFAAAIYDYVNAVHQLLEGNFDPGHFVG